MADDADRFILLPDVFALAGVTEASASDLLVYLAIAKCADKERVAWPSAERIARETGVALRTVRWCIARICRRRWIEKVSGGGRGKSNRYRILSPPKGATGDTLSPPKGATGDTLSPPKGATGDTLSPPKGARSCRETVQSHAQTVQSHAQTVQPIAPQQYQENSTNRTGPENKRGSVRGDEDVDTKKLILGKAVAIPPPLNTHDFRKAWRLWLIHRREMRKTVTSSTADIQLRKLEKMGHERAIETLEHSVANGWTGVFPVDRAGSKASGSTAENGLSQQQRTAIRRGEIPENLTL